MPNKLGNYLNGVGFILPLPLPLREGSMECIVRDDAKLKVDDLR
jgi:hypothetical protein